MSAAASDDGNQEQDPPGSGYATSLKEFCRNTTAHGFAKVEATKYASLRIFWVVVLLCSSGFLGWQLFIIVGDYFDWPTDTSISVEAGKDVNFPAVTICNLNPIKSTEVSSHPELNTLATGNWTAPLTRRKKRDAGREKRQSNGCTDINCQTCADRSTCDVCMPGYIFDNDVCVEETEELDTEFLTEQTLLEKYNTLNESERIRLSYQKEELLLDCLYKGTVCDVEDFYRWSNPVYGNCFTFNSGWYNLTADKAYRTGRKYGLKVILNVGANEYLTGIDNAAGLRIVVHDQERMPFPDEDGFLAHPGTMMSMAVKKEIVSRLSNPYGTCIESGHPDESRDITTWLYPVKYSQTGCNHACYQGHVIRTCGCFDANYFTADYTRACAVVDAADENCRSNVAQQYANGELDCDENCPQPCTETNFDVKVTSASWPSEKRLSKVVEKLQDKIEHLIAMNDSTVYHKNLMVLEVFYETFNYLEISESEAVTQAQVLAAVGGITGLALGFSIITFLEIVELIITLVGAGIVACFGRFRNTDTKTAPSYKQPDVLGEAFECAKNSSPPPSYSFA